jgi:hypothetical protein
MPISVGICLSNGRWLDSTVDVSRPQRGEMLTGKFITATVNKLAKLYEAKEGAPMTTLIVHRDGNCSDAELLAWKTVVDGINFARNASGTDKLDLVIVEIKKSGGARNISNDGKDGKYEQPVQGHVVYTSDHEATLNTTGGGEHDKMKGTAKTLQIALRHSSKFKHEVAALSRHCRFAKRSC